MTLHLDLAAAAALGFACALCLALGTWRLAVVMRRRALRLLVLEEQAASKAPELPEAATKAEEEALDAAVKEQRRREHQHRLKYRADQRLRATQQRMARLIGHRRAFSPWWTARIRAALLAAQEQPLEVVR